MEGKKLNWQIVTGAGLLLLLVITLFLPRIDVTEVKYVDTAVKVNQHAKEQNKKKALEAGAQDAIKEFDVGGSERKDTLEEVRSRLGDKNVGSKSTLALAKWMLTVNKNDKMLFDVIQYDAAKKDDVAKSGIKNSLRLNGILLLLPVAAALIVMILVLALRKMVAPGLIGVGALTVLSNLLIQFALPGMMWGKISKYIESAECMEGGLFDISGVGKYAISEMSAAFSSWGSMLSLVLGIVLIVMGILFLTAFRPKAANDSDDWQFSQENLDVFGDNGGMNGGFGGDINNVGANGGFAGDMNNVGANGGFAGDMNNNGMNGGFAGDMNNVGANGGFAGDMNNVGANGGFTGDMNNVGANIGFAGDMNNVGANGGFAGDMNNVGANGGFTGDSTSPYYFETSQPEGRITVVSGEHQGKTFTFRAGEEMILGRDPALSSIVFQYPKVSRRHCGIRFDAASGNYQVTDYSSNGTRLSNGAMVSAGSYTAIAPGTVIYLGNQHEAIQVG